MAKKKKTDTTIRQGTDQCKTSVRGYLLGKIFQTKEQPMLSFEQCMISDERTTYVILSSA